MYEAIFDLGARIASEVEDRHANVLRRFLDHLDADLIAAEALANKCSYGAALAGYVHSKIWVNRIRNHDEYSHHDIPLQYQHRLDEFETRMWNLKNHMYRDVCGECSSCTSRRKPWPTGVMLRKKEYPRIKFDRGPHQWMEDYAKEHGHYPTRDDPRYWNKPCGEITAKEPS